MINWIQSLLEKHRNWFFGGLLIVIIVPFVFTIGNMPGLGHKRKSGTGIIFGHDMSNRQDVERIVRDGAISISLESGSDENSWVESAKGYALMRLMLIKMADDIQLPKPNDDELLSFIKTKKLFAGKNGEFDAKKYNDYLENWERTHSKTDALRSILEDDYRCKEIRESLQEPGFVQDNELEMLYKNHKRTMNMSIVALNTSDHTYDPVTNEEVAEFFESNSKNYQIGPKADVSLLFFDFKNYKDKIPTPTKDELVAHFEKNKNKFTTKDDAATTFEAVEENVKKDWEKAKLSILAEKESNKFVQAVYESDVRFNSDAWNNLLTEFKVRPFNGLAPFAKDTIPEKKGLPKESLEKAFDLDEEKFISDPISVKNAYMVLALKKMNPPFVPDFEEVAEKVKEDANKDKQQKTFEEKVNKLHSELIADKANTQEILTKFNVEIRQLEPLSYETMFKVLGKELDVMSLFYFARNLQTITVGEWTEPIKTNNGLALLHLDSQEINDFDKTSEDFAKFSKNILSRRKQERADLILRELLEKAFHEAFPEAKNNN